MAKALALASLLALAGCSTVVQAPATASACASGEATYACQVERYHNVSGD